MPFYHQDCPKCGDFYDVLRSVSEYKICAKCSGPCKVLLYPVKTIGIVFSNAEVSAQLGTCWETNAQKRAYMKAHPNVQPMDRGSMTEQNFNHRIKTQMHESLKAQGMTQREFELGKKENKRYRDLKSGKADKKICVT